MADDALTARDAKTGFHAALRVDLAGPPGYPEEHGPAPVAWLTGATVTSVRCRKCSQDAPAECGDVTGMTIDDMCAQAAGAVARACPDHKEPVRVGTAR